MVADGDQSHDMLPKHNQSDDVLAEDSDGDNSSILSGYEDLENSQSGSILGDDFGHLHNDYTVKGRQR